MLPTINKYLTEFETKAFDTYKEIGEAKVLLNSLRSVFVQYISEDIFDNEWKDCAKSLVRMGTILFEAGERLHSIERDYVRSLS